MIIHEFMMHHSKAIRNCNFLLLIIQEYKHRRKTHVLVLKCWKPNNVASAHPLLLNTGTHTHTQSREICMTGINRQERERLCVLVSYYNTKNKFNSLVGDFILKRKKQEHDIPPPNVYSKNVYTHYPVFWRVVT